MPPTTAPTAAPTGPKSDPSAAPAATPPAVPNFDVVSPDFISAFLVFAISCPPKMEYAHYSNRQLDSMLYRTVGSKISGVTIDAKITS